MGEKLWHIGREINKVWQKKVQHSFIVSAQKHPACLFFLYFKMWSHGECKWVEDLPECEQQNKNYQTPYIRTRNVRLPFRIPDSVHCHQDIYRSNSARSTIAIQKSVRDRRSLITTLAKVCWATTAGYFAFPDCGCHTGTTFVRAEWIGTASSHREDSSEHSLQFIAAA